MAAAAAEAAAPADPRTGPPMAGEMRSPSAWQWGQRRPMDPRGDPRRSAGKAPAALTTPWKGEKSAEMMGPRSAGGSAPRPAAGTARPAGGGGLWKGCWTRGGLRNAGGPAHPRGEPSPPTGGGRAPRSAGGSARWTEGAERTEAASERGRR